MSTHTNVLLAGGFAAFTVDLLVYPLDTLKTRIQSPDYQKIYFDASKNAVNRKLLYRGLYQGVGSIILITIPSSGAFFTSYEAAKAGLSKATTSSTGQAQIPQPIVHSAASAIAELVSCFILTPAEVLKQNAQMIRRPESSSGSAAKQAFQPSVTMQAFKQFNKPSQLFRGYTALAARNLPFTAMQFPMFEHFKETIKAHRKEKGTFTGGLMETALTTAVSAGSAGSIAAVITTPVDVVKTRIMLSAAGETSEAEAMKEVEKTKKEGKSLDKLAKMTGGTRKSGFAVAKEIMGESGVKGLFRGGTLRAAWTALGSGLYLGVYESSKDWLGGPVSSTEESDRP
ncbi:mitochondrial carrier protein-like protein [Cadophora sp. MPI-SDFR-AT-0126]|nr:mitochondrial carrier protein-like protein [Leotiomycetes sp. MPI-SDFR-AT-0126]